MPTEDPISIARFWSKVDVGKANSCWEWRGAKNPLGYGRFNLGGKFLNAHRVAYELTEGPIADGNVIMHQCDNRSCCNPRHLVEGTQAENVADMTGKGRRIYAKTDDSVVEMVRQSALSGYALSRELGLSRNTISAIRNRTGAHAD